MSRLEPGSFRYNTLQAAKQFKSSWIELGKMLSAVWKEKRFREWGYLNFETYCSKEIGIRVTTAKKLIYSYGFLEKKEPRVLERFQDEQPTQLPDYDAVNVLRLLNERQQLPERQYDSLRTQVLDRGQGASEVRREVRSFLQEADPNPAAAREVRREKAVRRMIGTLKSVQQELDIGNLVPQKLIKEIEALTKKLEDAL